MGSRLKHEVVIVGAGLAGLCCARELQSKGIPFVLLEASDAVGGRVRTDIVDGYRLDRGFQVLLASYPELKRWLDLEQLQLRPFLSGARIRYRGRFHDLADPWRRPWTALASAFSPIGSLVDKLRIARLRSLSLAGTYPQRMQDTEQTTLAYLRELGFSPQMVDAFLKPFLGGIFLDSDLATSSRMLTFVFRMFSIGNACLPANGMQALPEQLASAIPPEQIRCQAPVGKVEPGSVTLESGERLEANNIVVAVDAPAARRLLPGIGEVKGRGVRCLYYSAAEPPFRQPILVLNGDGQGPINNLCVLSNAAPSYAPAGRSLISVTVLGSSADPNSTSSLPNATLEEQVRAQMRQWYGQQVNNWQHLRTYDIPFALPDQAFPALAQPQRPVRYSDGIFVCGDHRDNASIEGSMVSGRRTALAIAQGNGGS